MKQIHNKLKKFLIPVFISFLFLSGCEKKLQITAFKSIDGFSSPESVIIDSFRGNIFVSCIGEKLEPTLKDGDGYISKLSSEGVVLDRRYLPGDGILHSPKGMAIIGRTLFVTDIDRVVGFNLDSRQQNFEIDFSGEKTVFLNDLAVADEHNLFVSATDLGRIYKIFLEDKPRFVLVAENIHGANGLYFDKNDRRLFVVSFGEGNQVNGKLGVIDFRDKKPLFRELTGQIGGLDGVTLLPEGKILFSDWVAFDKPGALRLYDLKTGELSLADLNEETHGPADFFYDEEAKTLWLPKMQEGKVLAGKIK